MGEPVRVRRKKHPYSRQPRPAYAGLRLVYDDTYQPPSPPPDWRAWQGKIDFARAAARGEGE